MTQHLPGDASSEYDPEVSEETTWDEDASTETEDFDEESDTDDSQSTSTESKKTPDQLEYERKQAVKASLANNAKAKKAQAQANTYYTKMLDLARKNPDTFLPGIAESDEDLANQISQDIWGMDYQEAVNKSSSTDTDDIAALVEKLLEEKLSQKEGSKSAQELEQAEEAMFLKIARKYEPGSFRYKKVLNEYRSFGKPTSVKQAQAFFKAAQDVLRGGDDDTSIDMGKIPSMSFRAERSTDNLPLPSKSYLDAAKLKGISREQAIKVYRDTLRQAGQL